MYYFNTLFTASVTAVLALASTAWADTTYTSAATGSGTNGSVQHKLSETFAVSMGVNNYDAFETMDPQNPMNGASGTCFGLIEVKSDAWSGQGYCTMDDASGDQFIVSWTPNGPPLEYSWNLLGGTGKWVGASGGGVVRQTYHNEGKDFVSTFEGAITLK